MVKAMYTIKIRVGRNLLDRIGNVANYLNTTPEEFIQTALQNEIQTHEEQLAKENVVLKEINETLANNPQSILVTMDDDESAPVCQLCLKSVPGKPIQVDGPTLCPTCYNLAKGKLVPEVSNAG